MRPLIYLAAAAAGAVAGAAIAHRSQQRRIEAFERRVEQLAAQVKKPEQPTYPAGWVQMLKRKAAQWDLQEEFGQQANEQTIRDEMERNNESRAEVLARMEYLRQDVNAELGISEPDEDPVYQQQITSKMAQYDQEIGSYA